MRRTAFGSPAPGVTYTKRPAAYAVITTGDGRVAVVKGKNGYFGRAVALLLDEDPSHTARASQERAAELGFRLVWLPKRCPELNGMDHLWGHGKDHVCADRQYPDLDAEVERFIAFLRGLSNREALRQAGLRSQNFWLRL